MNVLIVGLGAMGKRRIRCLKALNFATEAIAGVDPRRDRRDEAAALHGVATYDAFETALDKHKPNALIISVPPAVHHVYMEKAAALRLPFFVEVNVVDTNMEAIIARCRETGLVAAPSATFHFHPGVQIVARCIRNGELGTISNVLYHAGQYLPDWHPYEHVRDFYVSNPATSGTREIVSFELTWLMETLGFPRRVAGMARKTITIEGAEAIDDTYNALLDYGDYMLNLCVDVVSRAATRRLVVNGDAKQLRWDWDERCVNIFDPAAGAWEKRPYVMSEAAKGYNVNIGENMYVEETRAFLDAARGGAPFVNTLERDHQVLKTLYAIEQADRESRFVPLDF